jgi:hypothetical protein
VVKKKRKKIVQQRKRPDYSRPPDALNSNSQMAEGWVKRYKYNISTLRLSRKKANEWATRSFRTIIEQMLEELKTVN